MLFGGAGGAGYLNDVWEYDTLADVWTLIDMPSSRCPGHTGFGTPDGRDTQSVLFDPVNNLLWSIGGGGYKCGPLAARIAGVGSNSTTVVDSTLPSDVPADYYRDWSVTVGNSRAYVDGYDPVSRTLRLSTPLAGLSAGTSYYLQVWTNSGSWYFSPVSKQWGSLDDRYWNYTGPNPFSVKDIRHQSLAYSTADQTMVMFGGGSNTGTNATWALDLNDKSYAGHPAGWVMKNATGAPGVPEPRGEINSSFVYDSRNDVFVLFGGRCSNDNCAPIGAPLGDTWIYRLATNTWTKMQPPLSPQPRMQHQMTFDERLGVVVLYGGVSIDSYGQTPDATTTLSDLWTYDVTTNTWTQIAPTVSPGPRYIGSLTYDPVAGASVLYGGAGPGLKGDRSVWMLTLTDPNGGAQNARPTAIADVSATSAVAYTTLTFHGSASSDSDGSIVSHRWDFGDGKSSANADTTHQYTAPGRYTAILTVTDNQGAIGKVGFNITVSEPDATPDPFTYPAVTGATPDAWVTSASATIKGINTAAPISILRGEYSVANGAFTSAPGTVLSGQTVRVRVRSSADYNDTTTATVNIGGVSAMFSATTGSKDTTPDPFSFLPVTNALPNILVTSAGVTIRGINAPAPITVTGGEYSIGSGAFTSAPGTVLSGQVVKVRLLSSANNGVTRNASVTVGGVSAAFSVTTGAADTTPDAFSYAPVTNAKTSVLVTSAGATIRGINSASPISVAGGEYSIANGAYTSAPGTVLSGQVVKVRLVTGTEFGATTSATVTVGGVSATFNVTTGAADTTPDAFSYAPVTNAKTSTLVTSAGATIRGINTVSPISVVGGEYSIASGSYTSAPGTVLSGQVVKVRLLTGTEFGATTSATVTVGGVSATFNVTTGAADTTPDAFSYAPVTNAKTSVLVTSAGVTIRGINTASPISVVGGEYSIASGAYTSAPGTVLSGQNVRLRLLTSTEFGATTSATVTVGGVSATFNVTTGAADTTPDEFSYAPVTNAKASTLVTSAGATIRGINTASPISVVGGEYSIASGTYTSAPGTVLSGQSVRVRLLTSTEFGATTSATVTVGGVSATFNVTTGAADTTPDEFSYAPVTNAKASTLVTSAGATIRGINTASPISVVGGEYSIASGTYTSAPGTVLSGQSVRVRLLTSTEFGATTSATVTVGGVGATFSVTTAVP